MLLKGKNRGTFLLFEGLWVPKKFYNILTSLFSTNFTTCFAVNTSFGSKPQPSSAIHTC